MSNGTLGQQIEAQNELQQQQRLSRTQRKQAQEQERVAKYKFEQAQAEAERLRAEVFIDKLTFEEYSQEYEKLSPDIKQFFVAPTDIIAEQERKKTEAKNVASQRIVQWQEGLEQEKAQLEKYREWFRNLSGKEREGRRESFKEEEEDEERDVEEFENKIRYLQGEFGKIDEGYDVYDLISYAEDKADYQRRRSEAKGKAREEFNRQLKQGNLDADLVKLGLSKTTTYQDYLKKTEEYNKNVAYMQQLQKWSEKVRYINLPQWTKEKLNPSAQEWQKKYPTEVLQFDKVGNVIAVESSQFGGRVYAVSEYDKKVTEYSDYNKKLEGDYQKQQQNIASAQAFLKEKGFAEGVSFTPPKQSVLSKAWSGIKTAYLSSPFGASLFLSETKQTELTALREQRVGEAFKPELTLTGVQLPAYKFFTLPLSKSWEAVQYQRQLDFKAKEGEKLFTQLETYSKEVSPELKSFVETEGLRMLKEKGIAMKEERTFDFAKADKYGNIPETTTTKITDPAFDRKISQNILEWEYERKKAGWTGEALLGTRIVSSKFLETYGLLKGVEFGVKGAVAGYKALRLPSLKFYKTVQLAEGTARVQRDFAGTKNALGLSLTGLYAYGKYQQYQTYSKTSKFGKEVFWLETAGELGGIEYATGIGAKTFNKAMNRIENWNAKTVRQADLSQAGFMRQNKLLGTKERVYMERYEGFKLSKPRSWLQTAKGFQKGQFTGRSYKYLPDELRAYYEYGGEVKLYPKGTKFKLFTQTPRTPTTPKRIIRAEPFPYDEPSTHLKWFKEKNIAEFPVPKKSKLPIKVKGKAFGYSATGEEWASTEFAENTILYDKGARALKVKGAVQYVSGKGVSGGFLRIFKRGAYERGVGKTATKPIIYADYIDKVQLNKAIREIRGVDVAGRELKAYLYTKDTGATGTLNIAGYKREVEGTIEISSRIPVRRAFAIKLEGWKVPIEEQVFASKDMLSASELKGIIKSMGKITEVKGVQYSSLPSKASSLNKAIYSVLGYSKPSYAKSSAVSRASGISGMSDISRVSSAVSRASGVSGVSRSRVSAVSDILRRSSRFDISRASSFSSTSTVPKMSRIFKPSKFETSLQGKIRRMRKQRITPEIEGLFPDFTARAVGLAPKEVSLKQALREIAKIQTGFEVRRGARLKGYTNIQEKNLLKGIMA
jgi:hypothetical protein